MLATEEIWLRNVLQWMAGIIDEDHHCGVLIVLAFFKFCTFIANVCLRLQQDNKNYIENVFYFEDLLC